MGPCRYWYVLYDGKFTVVVAPFANVAKILKYCHFFSCAPLPQPSALKPKGEMFSNTIRMESLRTKLSKKDRIGRQLKDMFTYKDKELKDLQLIINVDHHAAKP